MTNLIMKQVLVTSALLAVFIGSESQAANGAKRCDLISAEGVREVTKHEDQASCLNRAADLEMSSPVPLRFVRYERETFYKAPHGGRRLCKVHLGTKFETTNVRSEKECLNFSEEILSASPDLKIETIFYKSVIYTKPVAPPPPIASKADTYCHIQYFSGPGGLGSFTQTAEQCLSSAKAQIARDSYLTNNVRLVSHGRTLVIDNMPIPNDATGEPGLCDLTVYSRDTGLYTQVQFTAPDKGACLYEAHKINLDDESGGVPRVTFAGYRLK